MKTLLDFCDFFKIKKKYKTLSFCFRCKSWPNLFTVIQHLEEYRKKVLSKGRIELRGRVGLRGRVECISRVESMSRVGFKSKIVFKGRVVFRSKFGLRDRVRFKG